MFSNSNKLTWDKVATDMFIESSQKQYFKSLDEPQQFIDGNSFHYDKCLCIGYFNSQGSETSLINFCDLCKLKNLVYEPTKNPDNLSCIDFFLTNCSRSFEDIQVIETGFSDFYKINLIVLKMYFTKQKQETIFYRNY